MARPKAGETLTLYVGGERMPAVAFAKAVEHFLALTREIARELTGDEDSMKWTVRVKGGSAVLAFEPEVGSLHAEKVSSTVLRGMKQLSRRPRKSKRVVRPEHFSDKALMRAKELSDLVDIHKLEEVQVRQSRYRSRVTPQAAVNVKKILDDRPTEIGAIEGTLQSMSVRGATSFSVWDDLDDRQITCTVGAGDAKLFQQALAAFGKRVTVSGVVRVSEQGDPTSIQVRAIDVFPEPETLPTAEDVYGILSKGRE